MSLLEGGRDGLANVAPPARPFECLRVSGPTPAGWIPARRRNDGVKGGRGDWTPPPRFLAEPRNDRVKGVGWDEAGRDGSAVRGPPPLDPSMLQRRTSSLLRVSGPTPRNGMRERDGGRFLGAALFYYEVSGEVGQDLGARVGYEDGIGVDYTDLAVDFDVGDEVEDKAGFQGSLVVLDDAH